MEAFSDLRPWYDRLRLSLKLWSRRRHFVPEVRTAAPQLCRGEDPGADVGVGGDGVALGVLVHSVPDPHPRRVTRASLHPQLSVCRNNNKYTWQYELWTYVKPLTAENFLCWKDSLRIFVKLLPWGTPSLQRLVKATRMWASWAKRISLDKGKIAVAD